MHKYDSKWCLQKYEKQNAVICSHGEYIVGNVEVIKCLNSLNDRVSLCIRKRTNYKHEGKLHIKKEWRENTLSNVVLLYASPVVSRNSANTGVVISSKFGTAGVVGAAKVLLRLGGGGV